MMASLMSDHGETSQRVSVPEAAATLGLSVATVRRMIRDGRLRAETVTRPQGIAYVVVLPGDHAARGERSSTAQQVGTTARLTESPADAMATLIQATLTPIIAPLVAEQAALRQTVERQAEQLVGKEQEIGVIREEQGRLTAELERAASTVAALDDALTAHRRRVRAAAILAAVLAALALAAGIIAATGWLR